MSKIAKPITPASQANAFATVIAPAKRFAKDSMHFLNRCTKPDAKSTLIWGVAGHSGKRASRCARPCPCRSGGELHGEQRIIVLCCFRLLRPSSFPFSLPYASLAEYKEIAIATSLGFAIMGLIGFFVKLIHIPSTYSRAAA